MKVTVTYKNREPDDYTGVEAIHSHENGNALIDFGGDSIEISNVECVHVRKA